MTSFRLAHLSVNQYQGLSALATTPNAPGAEDIPCMSNRIIILEWLARLDGRNEPQHPHYATYTGLWQEFKNALKSAKTTP